MSKIPKFGRTRLKPYTLNGVTIKHPSITENDTYKQILGALIACSTNSDYMGYMKVFTGVTDDAKVYEALWSNIAGPVNPIKISDWNRFLDLCNTAEGISRNWLICIVLTLLNGDKIGFDYLITKLAEKQQGRIKKKDDGNRVCVEFFKTIGAKYFAFKTSDLRDACSAESALPLITQVCENWQGLPQKNGRFKKK